MTSHLAIVNLQRKLLPGPCYLDELVAAKSDTDLAVVYLDADDTTSNLSYAALHHASWKLACRIRAHRKDSSRTNTVIPVILPQGPLLYLSYLGVLRAGAAFCPVLPDTPDDRLHFIVSDVQADCVLCSPHNVEYLQNLLPSTKCIALDQTDYLGQRSNASSDHEQLRRPSDTAYVMYTSGSTGKPKGVPVSHRAVTQSLLAHDEHIPPFQRFFQFAAPTFDVSVFEIFFPWFRGATLASCERESTLADLPAVLRQLAVDAVELTPTVATTLLRTRDAVPGLTALLTIGEMLTPQIIEEFGGSTQQASILFAMYGPTEAAIHCTIVPAMKTSSSIRDIGRPLSTVTAFILKESDDPHDTEILRPGQSGELAVAGQLADGYLNRPVESRSAFVDLPGYGLVYRTGDRATMTSDGNLLIHGRISGGQVKLRGQRVELGEIESVALQVNDVDLAVAMIIQDALILFCSGQSSVRSEQIEARCKSWLPRHMRPGGVIVLEENMPRLPSGKIDRRGLEQLYLDSYMTTPSDESNSEDESPSLVKDIVAEALGTKIDNHQALWSSGLNSLRAISIASRLREHYQNISISTILEAETVSHLITMLESENDEPGWSEHASQTDSEDDQWADTVRSVQNEWSTREGIEASRIIPCSKMQIAMLAETSRYPLLNFNKIILRTHTPMKLAQLLEALKEVARKNVILRAVFRSTGSLVVPFVQVIDEEPSFEKTATMQHPLSIHQGKDNNEFIVTIHHALYDGWSWGLVMKDVNTFLNGGAVRARPSFERFSRLMQQKSETRVEEDLTAWTGTLQNVEFHRFPALHNTPSTSGLSHYSTTLSISKQRLSTFALSMRVNMATTAHAALSLLLAQYLDTNEVVTGMVLAGREPVMPEVEEVIGPCLLTLPLLARLSDKYTVRDLLLLLYQQHVYCVRHSSASLAEIANALSLPTETRLFDVLFVWQEPFHWDGQDSDKVFTTTTYDNLDYALVVEVEAKEDAIHLKTTYDSARLSPNQIELIHLQINALVDQFIRIPDTFANRIWDHVPQPLLSINQSSVQSTPDELTVTLTKTASKFSRRVAVDFVQDFDPISRTVTRETMTYDQLHKCASQIASKLVKAHKLERNDIVAICCNKSPSLYATIYGTILAGVAYLCVDTNTPEQRIRTVLQQANPKLVIVDGSDSRLMKGSCTWSVSTIEDIARSEPSDRCHLEAQSSGSDLAYAVFTSGSTGVPKGVLITRENLASNLQHLSCTYPFNASSRLLQSCSPAFDVSVFEIFWTWSCGLTLCSATNDTIFKDIESFINATDVTHLSMTPSVAALVNPSNIPKVNFLVCAGEPMSAKVYNSWVNRGLHQGYGPSETTNICNVRHYPEGPQLINNVGPAFPNTSLFVCSRQPNDRRNRELSAADLRILPRGAVGEIWIGGRQVGRGYTDAELTSRSFFDHPQHGRLFKSGDFGRLLPDDSLIVIGREDDQTKIRGQRIELNEVNSRLMQSVHVSDVFTMILLTMDDRQKLVAFWVYKDGNVGDFGYLLSSLYDDLHETLPSYMVPENLIPLPRLPLTSQGKVDKRALLATHNAMGQTELAACSPNHLTPGNQPDLPETVHQITSILADMIDVSASDINIYASLFSYGIDSIRAIVFARRMKAAGFTSVEVSDILKHPSVSRLASLLKKSSSAESGADCDLATEAVPLDVRRCVTNQMRKRGLDVALVLPCTPLQVVIALAHETVSQKAYSNHIIYHLNTDVARIKKAWAAMIDRHHLLRTMFAMTEHADYPCVQVVLSNLELPWHASNDDEEPRSAGSPFEQPPYMLYLKSFASYVELHLFIHHALYDAEALAHLQTDIQSYCSGGSLTNRPAFSAYVNFMLKVDQRASEQFWNHTLENVVPCHLSKSGTQTRSECMSVTRKARHSMSWKELTSYARKISVTPLALLQAALARLLSGYTHSVDICFGTVFSGRNVNVADVDKIIGPCFNTLPSRVVLRRSYTSADVCEKFHSFNIAALPYQATSLRELQQRHSLLGTPLFDVLLLLQSAAPKLDPEVWTLTHEEGQMAFPFVFEVQHDPEVDALNLYLHNNTSADLAFLDKILGHFADMITDTAKHLDMLALDRISSNSASNPAKPRIGHTTKGQTLSNGSTRRRNDTPTSRRVVQMLQQISKKSLSDITPSTTIFHLGLDSISTVQLAARLRKVGFQVSAGDLLDGPKVFEIFRLCERRQKADVSVPKGYNVDAFDHKYRNVVAKKLNIEDDNLTRVWPCTATQIGILSEYLKSDGRCYYNSVRLRLSSQTDIPLLFDALKKIIEIYAILRTGFVELDDIDIPYAMVIYSKIAPDIRCTNDATTSPRTSASLLEDLSQPPWYIRLTESGKATHVELHILHALYDAQSLRTILRDLAALYKGISIQKPPSVDGALSWIVANNNARCEAEDILRYSASEVQATKFPNLNILRDVPSIFATSALSLTPTLKTIQARCEALGCSLSTVLQATWAQLLAAYTGQSFISFGNIYSGRSFDVEDLNEVVFPCINTLPVFVDVRNEQVPIIEQVAKLNAHWQRNPHLSLSKIQRSLGIEGVLFDTVIALQSHTWTKSNSPWEVESEAATAEYSVSLEIFTTNDEVELLLTYNQAVLPREHTSILLKQYEVGLLDILNLTDNTPQISRSLLSMRPPTCKTIPSDQACLHDLMLASATRHPHKVAIEFVTNVSADMVDRQTWTYQETVNEASRFANLLVGHGARAGDMVALCCEKSPRASLALLGILMAGCAYVAIDPSAPASRREFILDDSHCNIVLVNSSVASSFAARTGTSCFCIDDEQLLSQQASCFDSKDHHPLPQDVCYCLYTSGTTGTPKGCLITHASAVQAMMSFSRIFKGHWTDDSKWLQFAAYHFDVSVLEHFWSWKEGICVTIVPRDLLFEDLPGTIDRVGITHLDLTPSLARLLTPESVPSLCQGVFIVGGEAVRQDIIETWGDVGCLYNFYGPSEVTIGCTVHPRVRRGVKSTNIGHQWDNVGAFVLEPKSQKPVPVGAVGELCLSGVLVGQGYLNRPELTAEKFTVLEATGERIYRSGDLVRMLHDCSFEFLGRIDDQVKLRGQRLEIGEINHAILRCSSGFQDTATLVLDHPQQEKEHLVTFLAREKGGKRSEAERRILQEDNDLDSISKIRSQALNHLPGYMVPTYFIVLHFLPLTVNNKVDMKALRSMYRELSISDVRRQQRPSSTLVNEESEMYFRLVSTIADYLKIGKNNVGLHDSLLQLGIDSISVIGLVRALRNSGYANASVITVLQRPVISDLAAILCASRSPANDVVMEDREECLLRMTKFADRHRITVEQALQSNAVMVENIAPCTALQEGMISKLLADDSEWPPYMTKFVFKLGPTIDLARLQSAWQALQTRLDILRIRFVPTDDGFAQVVLRPTGEPVLNVDTDVHATQADPLAAIQRRFRNWAISARNLGALAPWEARVVQYNSEKSFYMSIFMFHGLYDGIGIGNMLTHLLELYEDLQATRDVPQFIQALPHGPLLHKSDAAEFWRQNLPFISLLDPLTLSRPTCKPITTDTVHRELFTHDVHRICSTLAVTSQAVFHAAWLLTLAHRFGRNPTIGIVLSGRSIELERADEIIGPLFNTLPFHIDCLPRDACFADLMQACHKKNIDVLPYQHTSLSNIRRYLTVPPNQELFDSLFVYQTTSQSAGTSQRPWVEVQSVSQIEYALNFEIEELEINRYNIRIVASTDFLHADEIASLLDSFIAQLNALSDASRNPLPGSFFAHEESISKQSQNAATEPDGVDRQGAWTPDAEAVGAVLAELACVDSAEIGLHSPTIFELGLDSVDALKLVARLKSRNIQVSVSKVLQHPTVAGISAQHDLVRASDASSHAMNLPFDDMQILWSELLRQQGSAIDHVNLIVPTTPLQQGLLVEFKKYFHTMVFRISNDVDVSRLPSAIRECVRAMAMLRTSFATVEGIAGKKSTLMQIVTDARTAAGNLQLSHRLKDTDELKAYASELQDSSQLADSAPRLKIASLENGENYLVLSLSHASYDAWSIRLMLRHLEQVFTENRSLTDDTQLTAQYVYGLRKEHESSRAEKFWSDQLMTAKPTLVKIGQSRTQSPSVLKKRLDKASLEQIRSVCRRHGITLQSVGLAVWTLMLISLTQRMDVNFGVVVSGRVDETTEKLVFPTFNTVVFRASVDVSTTKRQLLLNVHNQIVEIFEHQQFPLSKALSKARRCDSDLFNTLFTFQRTPTVETGVASLFEEIDLGGREISPPYAVNVELQETNVGLDWTIATQKGVMSTKDVEDAFHSLDKILESLIAPETEGIFQVDADKVSICGLPPIMLEENREDTPSEDSRTCSPLASEEVESAKVEFSHVESHIRDVFSKVSGVDGAEITKEASLYHLGLDSVSAIKVSRLLKESGIKAPVSAILKHQTVAKIALATSDIETSFIPPLDTQKVTSKAEGGVRKFLATPLHAAGIAEIDVEGLLPATGGQVYMLDMWRASKGRLFYATFSFEVKNCNQNMFGAAFAELVQEIPALRTRFVMDSGRVYQAVFNSSSALHGPVQYKLAEQGSGLIVALHIHHALYDAISLDLMVRRLKRLCSTDVSKADCGSKPCTDQQAFLDALQLEKPQGRQFWIDYLAGIDHKVKAANSFDWPRTELFVPELLRAASLERVARREGVSIQAMFFAAVARVHARHKADSENGQLDTVVIGVYLANRSLDVEGLSDLAVPTFNIVPLKVKVGQLVSILEAAKEVQADLRDITRAEHCGISLRDIHAWVDFDIDCYVNFLRLPDAEAGTVRTKEQADGEVRIEHAEGELREHAKALIQADKAVSPFVQSGAVGKGDTEWCSPALDVEAKIDEQRNLAVGMFASRDMLDETGVRSLMQELRVMMQHLGTAC